MSPLLDVIDRLRAKGFPQMASAARVYGPTLDEIELTSFVRELQDLLARW